MTQQSAEQQRLDINRILDDASRNLIASDHAHRIRLSLNLSEAPLLLSASPELVAQVIDAVLKFRMDRSSPVLSIGSVQCELHLMRAWDDKIVPTGRYIVVTITHEQLSLSDTEYANVFSPFPTGSEFGPVDLAVAYGIIQSCSWYVVVERTQYSITFRMLFPSA